MNDYYKKVVLISKVKYDLDEDVVSAFSDLIIQCYNNEFTPRRTVEAIAEVMNFDLKD